MLLVRSSFRARPWAPAGALLALCMLVLAPACSGPGSSSWAADRKDGDSALKVEVVHLRPTRLERHYRTSGTLTALRAAEQASPGLGELRAGDLHLTDDELLIAAIAAGIVLLIVIIA